MDFPYEIIDLGLGWPDNPVLEIPPGGLSDDVQVRCLAYLARTLGDPAGTPGGPLEVIPMSAHPPWPDPDTPVYYPCLGLNVDRLGAEDGDPMAVADGWETRARDLVLRLWVERLVLLAAGETLTWADVLRRRGLAEPA